MFDQDHRKFSRFSAKCSLTLWQGGGYGTIMTNTVNIGEGGILVNLDYGLMIGAKVEIRMNLSNGMSFESNGHISRCTQFRKSADNAHEFFAVAIEFEGLNEQQKTTIKTIIKDFLN